MFDCLAGPTAPAAGCERTCREEGGPAQGAGELRIQGHS